MVQGQRGVAEKPQAWAPPISLLLIVVSMFAELGFHVAVYHIRSNLLDQGMLVNIQQPVIQSDGTLLLAADSKVEPQLPFIQYTCILMLLVLYTYTFSATSCISQLSRLTWSHTMCCTNNIKNKLISVYNMMI